MFVPSWYQKMWNLHHIYQNGKKEKEKKEGDDNSCVNNFGHFSNSWLFGCYKSMGGFVDTHLIYLIIGDMWIHSVNVIILEHDGKKLMLNLYNSTLNSENIIKTTVVIIS